MLWGHVPQFKWMTIHKYNIEPHSTVVVVVRGSELTMILKVYIDKGT